MAHPKVHAVPTLVLALVYMLVVGPLALMGRDVIIVMLVLFFGIFMDGDHLSIRRIKRILSGQKGPVPGWINWMHTWEALVGVVIVAIIVGNILPLLSYVAHILIDGGDCDNPVPSPSPLPSFIHPVYPRWLTYHTGLII